MTDTTRTPDAGAAVIDALFAEIDDSLARWDVLIEQQLAIAAAIEDELTT
jgi:hypothetical protein